MQMVSNTPVEQVWHEGPYEDLIKPAILKLVHETEGTYRCERDFHHHFTACLQSIRDLRLGTRQSIVAMEHPGRASYGSGRLGNLDYFFPADSCTRSYGSTRGTGVELNFNYRSFTKIRRDVIKLIDPDSAFLETVYLAFGSRHGFLDAVKDGIEKAFNHFVDIESKFLLPINFHVIVIQSHRGVHQIDIASVPSRCVPEHLSWSSLEP